MLTDKDLELLKFLTNETQMGKFKWQPTAIENQFTASLRGKYSVVMNKTQSGLVSLKLIDTNDQELVALTMLDSELVEQLYEFVRRKALDVDKVIDEIIKDQP